MRKAKVDLFVSLVLPEKVGEFSSSTFFELGKAMEYGISGPEEALPSGARSEDFFSSIISIFELGKSLRYRGSGY